MSELVGTPEDRFSRVAARISTHRIKSDQNALDSKTMTPGRENVSIFEILTNINFELIIR